MIKFIDVEFGSGRYQELLDLRYRILLQPLGLKFLDSFREQEAGFLHIGCIDSVSDKLIGGLIMVPVDNEEIRIMQVAVDDTRQGEGIGKKLIEYAEKTPKKSAIPVWLCTPCSPSSAFTKSLASDKTAICLKKKALTLSVWLKTFKPTGSIHYLQKHLYSCPFLLTLLAYSGLADTGKCRSSRFPASAELFA